MKRKLLALTLAMTTLVGSTMMASAAEISDAEGAAAGQEVTGESEITLPEIKVTVPTTADIVINPFQLSYDSGDGVTGSSQIISVEQEIKNESNVAVAVNVSDLQVTDASEGISIVTTALTSKNTEKAAFLYLEVTDGDKCADAYSKAANQIAIPKPDGAKVVAASKEAIVTLAAGDEAATTAKFKIGGNVVANPVKVNENKTTESAPWVNTDSIELGFKFTFTPQIVSAE